MSCVWWETLQSSHNADEQVFYPASIICGLPWDCFGMLLRLCWDRVSICSEYLWDPFGVYCQLLWDGVGEQLVLRLHNGLEQR